MSRRHEVQDATGIVSSIPGRGILQAYGDTVPADGATGYVHGAFFHHLDGTTTDHVYVNEGDEDSADFDLLQSA